RFDFADFDEKLRAVTATLSEAGEVISTLPAIDESGGNGIAFRLLYGSTLNDVAVSALAPDGRVSSLRKATSPAERGTPDVTFPVEAPEEDLSLRSLSQTVRVDIAKLDHVMNIVGELIVEKTQLDALTRAVEQQQARLTMHELTKIAPHLDRKTNELHKSVSEPPT